MNFSPITLLLGVEMKDLDITLRRILISTFALLVATTLTACGGDSNSGPAGTVDHSNSSRSAEG